MRKSSVFISVRDNSARARLYPLRVEVKIQRQLSRAGALIHSFLFRMPLARAVSLRKIVTGDRQSPCGVVIYATHPLTHGFTVAASLHRATIAGPRERGHWARGTALRGTAPRQRRRRARLGVGGNRQPGSTRRGRVRGERSGDARRRCGAGRALARASADTRQPPSQWRSGRVRARALRRSLPNLPDRARHLTTPGWTNPPRFSF